MVGRCINQNIILKPDQTIRRHDRTFQWFLTRDIA